jgi:BMFP domain-containing protein YqiC
MLGDRRFFDDMARVANGAAGALGGIRSRMEGELRDQVERLLARMNLVTREEFEVVAALARTARAEQEALAERLALLEAKSPAPLKEPEPDAVSEPPKVRAKRSYSRKSLGEGGPKATPVRRRRGEP